MESKLTRLEIEIDANLDAFVRVATAFLAIRDEALWHPHESFEDYCIKRWQVRESNAARFTDAIELVKS